MPSIATHHIFGSELFQELCETIGPSCHVRDAFLLGNIGPDPLFYLAVMPHSRKLRKLGSTMHGQRTPELLANVHERFIAPGYGPSPPAHAETLKAYALGFLCHYILDSAIHPLVFAQQYAICESGIEGLSGRRASRVAHATIETEYDEYVMTTHLGATVSTFVPHRETLRCPDNDLRELSHGISDVIGETYGTTVNASVFGLAVRLNRIAQAILDSNSIGVRRHFDYLKPLGMSSAYVLSMSHIDAPRSSSAFLNNDHVPWPHPFEGGSEVSASFDHLYEQAVQKAREFIPRFAQESFGYADCLELTQGKNFSGRRC